MTANVVRTVVVVALVSLFGGGCREGADTSDGVALDGALDGTNWRLQTWSVSRSDPRDFDITAEFSENTVSGRSAVNTYGGPYTATSEGRFSCGPLSMTEMAGPEAAMEAESIYLDLLGRAWHYALSGPTLTLYDDSRNVLLVYAEID